MIWHTWFRRLLQRKPEEGTPPAETTQGDKTGKRESGRQRTQPPPATPVTSEEAREILQHVIKPEERTLRNYASIRFWRTKREEYRSLREMEKHHLNVYSQLYDGARPTIEYYILTVLSCVIATTGLLQGSTATIIGAMIVAPMMTPILAFSLGVIWGDVVMIRVSLQSLAKGVLLAVLISSIIAFVIPVPSLSHEIITRTNPTLFDIIVAFASGIVGAYGNANNKISNTLVGIAIAVALMPPLCTAGIGIGKLDWGVASGAALLFLINLISISLAGAIVFWIMKIHPILADAQKVKKRAIYQIVLSFVILTAIAVPVGLYMWDGYRLAAVQETLRSRIAADLPGMEIISVEVDKDRLNLTLTGSAPPSDDKIRALKRELTGEFSPIRTVAVTFMQSTKL